MYKNKYFLVLFLFFILIFAGLSIYFLALPREVEDEHPKIKISSLPQKVQVSFEELAERIEKKEELLLPAEQSFEHVIDEETFLRLELTQKNKDIIDSYELRMPDFLLGLTESQLKKVLDEWELLEFKPGDKLIITGGLEESSAQRYGLLGVHNGRVAIFIEEDRELKLKQVTDIKLEELPDQERRALSAGISVDSQTELLALLEGLLSYRLD